MIPATIIVVALSVALVYTKTHVDVIVNGVKQVKEIATWAAIWPIFGAANQMVAALNLLGIAAWVKLGLHKSNKFLYIPFWFMLVTTVYSLVIQVKERLEAAVPNYLLLSLGAILIVLGVAMSIAGVSAMNKEKDA